MNVISRLRRLGAVHSFRHRMFHIRLPRFNLKFNYYTGNIEEIKEAISSFDDLINGINKVVFNIDSTDTQKKRKNKLYFPFGRKTTRST